MKTLHLLAALLVTFSTMAATFDESIKDARDINGTANVILVTNSIGNTNVWGKLLPAVSPEGETNGYVYASVSSNLLTATSRGVDYDGVTANRTITLADETGSGTAVFDTDGYIRQLAERIRVLKLHIVYQRIALTCVVSLLTIIAGVWLYRRETAQFEADQDHYIAVGEQCENCGIGYYLHLGNDARCDHCDLPRTYKPKA
jgi:hypothetical protein